MNLLLSKDVDYKLVLVILPYSEQIYTYDNYTHTDYVCMQEAPYLI